MHSTLSFCRLLLQADTALSYLTRIMHAHNTLSSCMCTCGRCPRALLSRRSSLLMPHSQARTAHHHPRWSSLMNVRTAHAKRTVTNNVVYAHHMQPSHTNRDSHVPCT